MVRLERSTVNGIVSGFYPTIVRGNGVGYASGMGRAAGYLLAAKLPLEAVLASIAAPYIVVAGVCLALDRPQRRMAANAESPVTSDIAAVPAPLRSAT